MHTDTHDMYTASFGVAQNMVEHIKTSLPGELLEHFDLSKAVAFSYTHALTEMAKDNPVDVALRAQFLKSIVANTSNVKKIFTYDHGNSRWLLTKDKTVLKKNSPEVNSENVVSHVWENLVMPSYQMMLNASSTILSLQASATPNKTRSP